MWYLLLLVTSISLPLLIIVLDQLGFILWNLNLKLDLFCNPFIPWLKLNLVNLLRSIGLTVDLSFKWLIFLSFMASYINIAVLPLHNKTQLWRVNISIYFVLQELLDLIKYSCCLLGWLHTHCCASYQQTSLSSFE